MEFSTKSSTSELLQTDSDAGEQGSLFWFDRCFQVWNIPSIAQKAGRFNVTLKFLDQQSIVVADGCGTLYLIETTDRSMDSESWAVSISICFQYL